MVFTLYHLANSRSQRVLWILEELGCSYHLVHGDQLPDELKPMKFPSLRIEDAENKLLISETGAIIEFLAHQFSHFEPKLNAVEDAANYYFWKNYADGSFMPDLALKQVFNQIVSQTPLPLRFVSMCIQYGFNKGYLESSLSTHLQKIEAHLDHREWLGQDFGIPDIMLWFPLKACLVSADHHYPSITAYIERMEGRTAFRTALLQGEWSERVFQQYWK